MSETSEEFWAAVRRLPPRQAQAAALRFVYDMPIADIAVALDCTPGTSSSTSAGRATRWRPVSAWTGGGVMSLDARIAAAVEDLERQTHVDRRLDSRDSGRRTVIAGPGGQSRSPCVALLVAGAVWRLGGPPPKQNRLRTRGTCRTAYCSR